MSKSLLNDLIDLKILHDARVRRKKKIELQEQFQNNMNELYNSIDDFNNSQRLEVLNAKNYIRNNIQNKSFPKFNFKEYYDGLLETINIREYVSMDRPKINLIKKQAKLMKKYAFLEKVFKKRVKKRIESEKRYKELYDITFKIYEKMEKENLDNYNLYVNKIKNKNRDLEKNVDDKKQAFFDNEQQEIEEILNDFINNYFDIGININIKYISNTKTLILQYHFPVFEAFKNFEYKEVKYIKSTKSIKYVPYNENEKNDIYDYLFFNHLLFILSFFFEYLPEKIENIVCNGYVNTYNLATGNRVDLVIFSCIVGYDKYINIDLENVNSKEFFKSNNARFKEPIRNFKEITPFHTYNESKNIIENIDTDIDGFDFENLSKILLENNNFENVSVTKSSGDYGADIIAYKDDVKYAIQCKKYSSPVGVKAVQEIIAAKNMYLCHVGVVLTNNSFTMQAIKLANSNNILLWDREKLKQMINNVDNEKIHIKFNNKEKIEEKFENDYYCNNCGSRVEEDSKYCDTCGAEFLK